MSGDKLSSPEGVKLSLSERTKTAKAEARPLAEVEQEDSEGANLVNDFIHGRISLQEFTSSNLVRHRISRPGEVELASVEEMRTFLTDLLKDPEVAEELASHEGEHLEEVRKIGWPARLLFRFFRDENGALSGRPGTEPTIPETGDEDDIRQKLKAIIEAAHEMSDTDHMATKKV